MDQVIQHRTKKIGTLRMIETGDIHMCHRRTPTYNILATLNYIFYEKESLADTDLIALSGDVWDRLVTQSNPDAELARQWIRQFVEQCAIHNVVLRVLEGTPDHDWKQSAEFVLHETTCDVKHITDITYEFHERLGISMLFVPDEIRSNHEEIWKGVCEVLAYNSVERVDLAFMHGAFDFHHPAYMGIPSHDTERYSSIVKYGVFVNHIHTAAHKNKVHGPGSPDRLANGEEGDKGYFRVNLDLTKETMAVHWIKNPHAWTYIQKDISGMTIDSILEMAKDLVKGLRPGSYIWLRYGDTDVINSVATLLGIEYPAIHWEVKKEKTKRKVEEKQLYTKDLYRGTSITKQNVMDACINWLKGKEKLTDDELPLLNTTLTNAINEMRK